MKLTILKVLTSMNGIIHTLLFKLFTLDIFRRRYYVYRNIKNNDCFVKTCKLFFIPKYIYIDSYGNLIYTYWSNKAVGYCCHKNIDAVRRTISRYKTNYTTQPKLRYERISIN